VKVVLHHTFVIFCYIWYKL